MLMEMKLECSEAVMESGPLWHSIAPAAFSWQLDLLATFRRPEPWDGIPDCVL